MEHGTHLMSKILNHVPDGNYVSHIIGIGSTYPGTI